jgi:hypothetical protein
MNQNQGEEFAVCFSVGTHKSLQEEPKSKGLLCDHEEVERDVSPCSVHVLGQGSKKSYYEIFTVY